MHSISRTFMRAANCSKTQLVQILHKLQRTEKHQYKFYSLPAIIAVGDRVNSSRATEFRQWAAKVLDTFAKQGYVLDKSRLMNGQIFDEDYFDHLISEIQEIRASERRFYQKTTDIQRRRTRGIMPFGNTAAEIIVARTNRTKEHMGLTSWRNAPNGKIVNADVSIAKNLLIGGREEEAKRDCHDVSGLRYKAGQTAYSHDNGRLGFQTRCASAIHRCRDFTGQREVTATIAKSFAESEFEKYRIIQDRLHQSDFDRLVASVNKEKESQQHLGEEENAAREKKQLENSEV